MSLPDIWFPDILQQNDVLQKSHCYLSDIISSFADKEKQYYIGSMERFIYAGLL